MSKPMVIPPITKNPRLGKETERDGSVMYGGALLPKGAERSRSKKPGRRRKQHNFVIWHEVELRLLSEKLGMPAAGVVNLGIATLAKEWGL